MADIIFVNTSGWEPAELKDLDEMVKEDGTDRSKFLRRLTKIEKTRRNRRAEYLKLARKVRQQKAQVTQ